MTSRLQPGEGGELFCDVLITASADNTRRKLNADIYMSTIKDPILFSKHFGVASDAFDDAGLIDPFLNGQGVARA